MKRLHIHLGVADLARSVAFYSNLFGVAPEVKKADYAKWMLDDPRVNFAISTIAVQPGIDHLGIQAESADELAETAGRIEATGQPVISQGDAACCYTRGEKQWVTDPDGIAWESFHTTGEIALFGGDVIDLDALAGANVAAEKPA